MALSVGTNVKVKPIRSSLPYQIILYFNAWYLVLFFLAEIGILIWKGVILPYPIGGLASEFVLIFITAISAAFQIRTAQRGNLTQRVFPSVISILFLAPVFVGVLYFFLWQTYVLYIDVALLAIEMAFIGFELILGIICIITFAR